MRPSVKKALQILKYFLLSLGILLLLLVAVINLPFAHKLITSRANNILKESGYPVSVGAVSFSLLGNIELNKIRVQYDGNDTIIYAGTIKAGVEIMPLFFRKIIVNTIFIEDVTADLVADSSGMLNLISVFSPDTESSTQKTKSGNPWEIQIQNVQLKNINFHYSDPANNMYLGQSLANAELDFDAFSLIKKQIDIGLLKIENANGFASIGSSTVDTVKSNPSPWKFSARDIRLVNVVYTYDNPSSRQMIAAKLKKASVSVKIIDLSTRELVVTALTLESPNVNYRAATDTIQNKKATITSEKEAPGAPWSISCKTFDMRNGNFILDTSNASDSNNFAQWLPVREINSSIKDIHFNATGMGCSMEQLSLSMNNRLVLNSGKIKAKVDSSLSGQISVELLAYTNLRNNSGSIINDTISVAGMFSGSMKNLQIETLRITALSGAKVDVSGLIKNVDEIPNAYCDLTVKTNSISRNQTGKLLSLFNTGTELPLFQPFIVSGKVSNTFYNPDFNFTITSGSGKIGLAGNYDTQSHNSKLNAALADVKLQEILGNQYPENLTANLIWRGRLGSLNELEGSGSVEVNELVYRDLTTHDFNLDFQVADNHCLFTAIAADTILSCNLNGEINWDLPAFNGKLAGDIHFDEAASDLLPGSNSATTQIAVAFNSSPGVLESSLSLFDLELNKDNISSHVDTISLNLNMQPSSVKSNLKSDFMIAEFNCSSGLNTFTDAVKQIGFEQFLKLDSTNFINAAGISALPVFDLTASAKYDSIVNLFIPDSVFSFNTIELKMSKSEDSSLVQMDLSVDSICYRNIQSFGTKIAVIADDKEFNGKLTSDSMNVNGVWSGPTEINVAILPDKVTASAFVADSSGAPVYRLGAEALKGKDRVTFRTAEPDWIINSDKWILSSPELLIWEIPTKDFLANFNLQHDLMTIELTGRKSDSLHLDLKNVLISNLVSYRVIPDVPDGILNAKLVYSDNDTKYLDFKLTVDELKWKDVLVDHVEANGYFSMDTSGAVSSDLMAHLDDSSSFQMKISPGNNLSQNNISTSFRHIPIKLIEPFTREYVNKLDGYASGELIISNDPNRSIDGKIRLQAITLNIVPLQAWFTIPDDEIVIKANQIYFDRFLVLDSLKKDLYVNGTLSLENTDNIIADLKVNLDDIRVMNTTVKDNPDFFGSIIVNSSLDITGPVTQPAIKGNIKLQEGTNITYRQINDVSVQETQKIVTFASLTGDSTGQVMPITRIREVSGMPAIQTTIEVNPKSKFNFEISSGYDIHIGISGNGLLNYAMSSDNSMNLTGTYEINQGTAELKFTGWPLKYFSITSGSSLRWDGDVTDPEINLEATSKVEGSYINPVDNKTRYVDFIVSMKLSNQLSKLDIVFSVKSPDQYITSVLNALPEDEQMRQAINLLIFESINLPNIESSSNYLDSQINSFWESQLNSLTKTSFKKIDLSFGVDTYTQTSAGGAEEEKTSLSYEVQRKFMHDRASVKVSGRFNDDPQAGEQANTVLENFIFEYELDTMERKFLKLYTKKDYEDILDGEVTKSGVGFIYRKSYPDFRSIWQRKKKTVPATNQETPKTN